MNMFTFVALVLLVVLAGVLGYFFAGSSGLETELNIARAVNEEWAQKYHKLEETIPPLATQNQELRQEVERLKILIQQAEQISGQEAAARLEAQSQLQKVQAILLETQQDLEMKDRLLQESQAQNQQARQQNSSPQEQAGPESSAARVEAPLAYATHLARPEASPPEGFGDWPLVVVFLAVGAFASNTVGSLRRKSSSTRWVQPRDILDLPGEAVSTSAPLAASAGLLPAAAGETRTGEEAVWVWVPREEAGRFPIWRSGDQVLQGGGAAFLAGSRVQVLMTHSQALRFSHKRKNHVR